MTSFIQKSWNTKIYPWVVCGIGMLFYFYNFFLRVSPSVMHEEMMNGLHISAYQFGNLAAFYYFAYTPMQIPAGILYDIFGVRVVQFIAVLVALLGLSIFIFSESYWAACLGRFLIGLGGAFAYIGVMKLISNWLLPNRFGLAAGMTTTFGMCAAILSDSYLSKIVHQVGYKNALMMGLVMGVCLSIIIILFMRSKPKLATVLSASSEPAASVNEVMQGLTSILVSKQMWLIGIIGCLTYLPSTVFLDLWGIPYLKATYHLSPDQAGHIASAAFMGWIIGGPLIGGISDRLKRRRSPLIVSYLIVAILFGVIFYVPNLSQYELYISLFLIGVACGSHPLCIALGKENNPLRFSGISVAFSNCITMLGGVVFQPLVGKLLDIHAGVSASSHTVYNGNDFTFALSVVPIGLFISVFLSFFLRETYCNSYKNKNEKTIFIEEGLPEVSVSGGLRR